MSEQQERLNPEQRAKIKTMVNEIARVMFSIKQLQDSKKDVVDEIHKQFHIPKKQINLLAKARFKECYADLKQEHENFEFLYESIFELSNGQEESE